MDKDPKIDEHIRPRVSDSTVVFNSPSSSLLGLNRGKIETSPFRREPGQGHCRQDVKSKYCKPLNGDFTLTVGSIPVSGDKNSSDQPSRKNESTQTNTGAVDERPKKSKGIANPGSITPTVILNGLAMARGEAVSYQVIEKTPLPTRPIYDFKNAYPYSIVSNPDYYTRNINAFNHESLNRNMGVVKRWIYPYIFHIQVTVGDRSFTGEGKSRQAAKHNAAKNALEVLQKMPIPKHTNKRRETSTHSDILLNGGSNSATSLKSKISILYEKVSASRLKINFEVISETGPPHLKLFQMRVIISKSPSDIVLTAEGTGNNKHSAKTNAAEAALDKIRDTPLPRNASGKKNRSKAKLENILLSNVTLHPSSRLSQIMQAQNKTMPTYKIISSDTTNPHKSSYVTQCVTDSQTTTGHGKSKRDAKRDASEKMLIKLGFQSESVKEDQQSKSSQSSTASKHSLIKARPKGTSMDILPPLLEDVFLTIRRQKTTIFTDAKESMLVVELKKVLEGILKIPPEDQMLYAYKDDQQSSVQLEDNKSLADSGFTSQTAKAQSPGILGLAIRDGDAFEQLTIEQYSSPPELPDVMKTHDGIAEQKK